MKSRLLLFVSALLLACSICGYADETNTTVVEPDNYFYEGVAAYRKYNFDEAASLFEKAANAGDADAQFLLGRMHYDGNSLTVDDVTAYMWFDIAAHNGVRVGARYREGIAKRMSAEDIEVAKKRAQQWRSAHPTADH